MFEFASNQLAFDRRNLLQAAVIFAYPATTPTQALFNHPWVEQHSNYQSSPHLKGGKLLIVNFYIENDLIFSLVGSQQTVPNCDD